MTALHHHHSERPVIGFLEVHRPLGAVLALLLLVAIGVAVGAVIGFGVSMIVGQMSEVFAG